VGRRSGDGRDGRHGQDFADLEHIDAEQLAAVETGVSAETEQQQFSSSSSLLELVRLVRSSISCWMVCMAVALLEACYRQIPAGL